MMVIHHTHHIYTSFQHSLLDGPPDGSPRLFYSTIFVCELSISLFSLVLINLFFNLGQGFNQGGFDTVCLTDNDCKQEFTCAKGKCTHLHTSFDGFGSNLMNTGLKLFCYKYFVPDQKLTFTLCQSQTFLQDPMMISI